MPVVTISRQLGSWGDEIAQDVATELGVSLVDREIIRTLQPSLGWFIGLGVAVLALVIGISAWMS